jgi:hypothetical protein
MKKFFSWIWYSSVDANKVSSSIKNIAVFIPTLIIFLNLLKIQVDPGTIQSALDGTALLVTAILGVISAGQGLFAIFRKLFTTVAGTNAVINQSV